MPKKLDRGKDKINKETPKAILETILKGMLKRLNVGGREYGQDRWAKRTVQVLFQEGDEELLDYLNWRVLSVCDLLLRDHLEWKKLMKRRGKKPKLARVIFEEDDD